MSDLQQTVLTAIQSLKALQKELGALGVTAQRHAEPAILDISVERLWVEDSIATWRRRCADLEAKLQAVTHVPESMNYLLWRYSQDHSGEDHQARVVEVATWLDHLYALHKEFENELPPTNPD